VVDMSAMNRPPLDAGLALGLIILFVDGYDIFILGTVGPALLAYHHGRHARHPRLLGSATALACPSAPSRRAGGRPLGSTGPMTISLAWVSIWMLLSAVAPTVGCSPRPDWRPGSGSARW